MICSISNMMMVMMVGCDDGGDGDDSGEADSTGIALERLCGIFSCGAQRWT